MILLASFVSVLKALVLLFCILSPLYIIVEIVQKLIKGKGRRKNSYLYILLHVMITVVVYYCFLTDKQRTFLFVFDGILIFFLCIYFVLERIFCKK